MRTFILRIGILFALASIVGGCQSQNLDMSSAKVEKKGPPIVVASLSPHVWLANMIGGDQVEVIPLMPAGENPETWNPDDAQLQQLAVADLIIVNGSMLEKWIQRVSLPFSTLDLSRSVKDYWQEYPGVVTHSHGPEGERSWEGTDGHFWIDPALLHLQGETILKRMVRLVPGAETEMRKNWQPVSEKLRGWEKRIAAIQLPEGFSLVATEPSWGYLAHRLPASLVTISPAVDADSSVLSEMKSGGVLWRNEPGDEQVAAVTRLGFDNVIWPPAENLGDLWVDYPQYQEQGITALEEAAAQRP
ncbi:MAG: hypothetical protein CMJ92_08055 [Planctomycetes bacterium]|nr:hypothetical protein [Planctomycetota bacterium]